MRPVVCWLALAVLAWSAVGCSNSPPPAPRGKAARAHALVASVGREPYHRPTCRWAAKIAEANLIGYDTPAQAEADGHHPCKVCTPERSEKP